MTIQKIFNNKNKKVSEFINRGREWCRKKREEEGWRDTDIGLLPFDEVVRSGLKFCSKSQSWAIPRQIYFSDGSDGRMRGSKYFGASQQFIKWRRDYTYRKYNKIFGEAKIDEDIKEAQQADEEPQFFKEFEDKINVNKIEF